MNPLKCAFGVSAGKFLGFIIHEHGIEIDPKSVESIRKLKEPTCKRDVQKLLGKINYLRRFISNLAGKIESFIPLLRLKHEAEFTWGAEQHDAFSNMKRYLLSPPVLRAPKSSVFQIIYCCTRKGDWRGFGTRRRREGVYHCLCESPSYGHRE